MSDAEFSELEDLLDDIRKRKDETPQWEFCEGFLAALICCRSVIRPGEYLPVLLDTAEPNDQGENSFQDDAQQARFMALWLKRWNQITDALVIDVQDLADERAYHPEIMDVRGALSMLRSEDSGFAPSEKAPSFAQVWAIGFMYAVETWPQEWEPPHDKDLAVLIDESLSAIVALTQDDNGPFTRSFYSEGAPPSVSDQRADEYGDAVWAVYNLRKIMGSLSPGA